MALFKRFGLFLLTNALIMFMLVFIINLLGIDPYMTNYGIDYVSLMIFCLIWGMGGAFISLLMSKQIAKWTMGLQFIGPNEPGAAGELVRRVHHLARGAGLGKMPDVAIYRSPEVNAFATGPSRNNSLVAVSEGLLNSMSSEAVEGVLAHEVSHIANGDMVTMTLIQGLMNAFVMFFARVAAYAVSQAMRGDDKEGSSSFGVEFVLIMVFQLVFGILGQIVVSWFSRHREFRADYGSAKLAGRVKMIAALEALRGMSDRVAPHDEAVATLKISGRKSFAALFSTHPPLEDRIEALRRHA